MTMATNAVGGEMHAAAPDSGGLDGIGEHGESGLSNCDKYRMRNIIDTV